MTGRPNCAFDRLRTHAWWLRRLGFFFFFLFSQHYLRIRARACGVIGEERCLAGKLSWNFIFLRSSWTKIPKIIFSTCSMYIFQKVKFREIDSRSWRVIQRLLWRRRFKTLVFSHSVESFFTKTDIFFPSAISISISWFSHPWELDCIDPINYFHNFSMCSVIQ